MVAGTAFKTELFSIAQLLKEVSAGRVRVPLFQRGFVWNDDDRLQLFDSIAKAYPIGTLLLAKGRAPAGTLKLGDYEAPVEGQDEALWVVDGQQRLSTLAMSLLGDFTGARRPIYFDLESNAFVLGPRKRSPPPAWVPTHLLSSAKTLNAWLRRAALRDELNDRADAMTAALREYSLPAYVVPFEEDDRVPVEIFARINRRGRALTRQEVFDALHMDASGMKPLERVDTSLARLGFGRPGLHIVERSTVALLGRAPGALPENLRDLVEEPAKLFRDVESSLARAVEFLSAEADVPHADWLPYDGALPTLARFFSFHPTPHARNLELLVRWFWRATLTGNLETNNAVDGHRWKAITADEHQSVQNLLRLVPPVPEERYRSGLGPFRRGTARARIETLALYALGPVALTTEDQGGRVEPASILSHGGNGGTHEVPWLLDDGTGAERTLAHALLHPKVPIEELREVPWDAARHATHGIERDAWEAFVRGDLATFTRLRRARLAAHVHTFLVEHLGFDLGDHDRPPLDVCLMEESA